MAEIPWRQLEDRLQELFESGAVGAPESDSVDAQLAQINLLDENGALTGVGERYAMSAFVRHDDDDARALLGEALSDVVSVRQFCAALWPHGPVPVAGAVSFLLRLMHLDDETVARRWLELMNRARLVAYNRSRPQVRVLFNPSSKEGGDASIPIERVQARIIAPDTPFGNVRSVKGLIETARGTVRWYEQHMPPKVLEILYESIARDSVSAIRLLSGPTNLTVGTQGDFKRFQTEMRGKRNVTVEWRALTKTRSQELHDRFFLADGISVNLPPLNSILRGSTGEILPSAITPAQFDAWWSEGGDILSIELDKHDS